MPLPVTNRTVHETTITGNASLGDVALDMTGTTADDDREFSLEIEHC